MISIPIYDLIILPGVTFYFKVDTFDQEDAKKLKVGETLLFLMLKEAKEREEMNPEDFYEYGVVGTLEHFGDDGNIRIRANQRVRITDIDFDENETIYAEAVAAPEFNDMDEADLTIKFEKIKSKVLDFIKQFQWGIWARSFVLHWKTMNEMVCGMAQYLSLKLEEKYAILASETRSERCQRIEDAIYEFIEITKISQEAETAQKQTNEQAYREAALKKQIDFLQNQLDEMHPENVSDVRKFEKKLAELPLNEEARRETDKVLNRMKQEGKDSHEYGLLYDYLDFITSLCWEKPEMAEEIDLEKAEAILAEDHYGLTKVKERIIQQLAVMALNKEQAGSILLFIGPPGTGKTSIGQSIAKSLGREYVRISLGGVKDEAEIRGHRRTYVGAMPGRIMEGMKRAGTSNPVIVLDEIDKLSHHYSGDPASALLEVLDPEQNFSFTDHYMNVPYDLSNVLFICTANALDTIPEPLLNRMEMIQFSGYTEVEKFQIARKHLLPKAMEKMGIKSRNLKLTDDALRHIISEYTVEAGVRGLKKQMDNLCRYVAVMLVKGKQKSITISEKRLKEILGRKPIKHDKILEDPQPGVVTGLAWTQAGGEILFIETSLTKGDGKMLITGQLGDVMKESARIALTIVKKLYPEEAAVFDDHDLHIHVPAGATPKDGPSAGITLVTALASLITGKTPSPEYAMTGEVSLRGTVMPIGGLPEKLMAAGRAGIKTVFIPKDNVEDLEEVSEEVKAQLKIVPVSRVEDVLKVMLK
ncbi:MAG: endopeptidase La [Lachnospiraceae bacterium]|nr:endopeptidase La [Lachnospiraceae bacterium]